MTNTQTDRHPFAEIADAELARDERRYADALDDLKRATPMPYMMVKVTRARHKVYLAGEFASAGIERAVEIACGWRELDLVGEGSASTMDIEAMRHVGKHWLLNHQTEIEDVLLGGVGSDHLRRQVLSFLIVG